MTNRRDFLKSTGALAVVSSMPVAALGGDTTRLSTRLIPGTNSDSTRQ
jgi:hypothetical protein